MRGCGRCGRGCRCGHARPIQVSSNAPRSMHTVGNRSRRQPRGDGADMREADQHALVIAFEAEAVCADHLPACTTTSAASVTPASRWRRRAAPSGPHRGSGCDGASLAPHVRPFRGWPVRPTTAEGVDAWWRGSGLNSAPITVTKSRRGAAERTMTGPAPSRRRHGVAERHTAAEDSRTEAIAASPRCGAEVTQPATSR